MQAKATAQKRVCKSCSAVLSRYNPESLCMPCQEMQQREKGLAPKQLAVPKESEQRWCDGCQKFRFAGAWGKRGICRFCEETPEPPECEQGKHPGCKHYARLISHLIEVNEDCAMCLVCGAGDDDDGNRFTHKPDCAFAPLEPPL
jgi:hypothetical protein